MVDSITECETKQLLEVGRRRELGDGRGDGKENMSWCEGAGRLYVGRAWKRKGTWMGGKSPEYSRDLGLGEALEYLWEKIQP